MPAVLENVNSYNQPSFSLKNRLARIAWGIVYVFFFRTSPRPLHFWRSFLLRCFGAKLGKNCHVYPKVQIWAPWNLVMADYSGMANDVNCYSIAIISLGKKVVVSQGTYLCTGTHNYEDQNFQLYAKAIYIEDNVWLCAQSFIGPGVTISEGAVIGARAVVTKDMPAWTVCAGNPCKPIKPRILKDL
ncbi:MAG: colanic acid biosynthesis acetyltransferase WcaF [Nostocaceae cyanobacterium]|nr:colanic acid biosynthesis acetyltransferase WcaF [Nostocaceae cyanobacterium]